MKLLHVLMVLGLCCATAVAQPSKKLTPEQTEAAIEETMKKLRGHWIAEKSEKVGVPRSPLSEDAIFIQKDFVVNVTKAGDLVFNGDHAEIVIDPTKQPATIDFKRRNNPRLIQGIYKLEGDQFTIAANLSKADTRPSKFSTNLAAGAERATNIQVFKRVPVEGLEAAPAAKKDKLTQDQIDAANAAALKSLQGHWIFEKSERNGFSYWVPSEESIYIQNELFVQAKKNGDLVYGGDHAKIKVDATRSWMTIDLNRSSGNPRLIRGIFKVDKDRLVLATNTSEDLHEIYPKYFSTKLIAGLDRAAIVQTYKRVVGEPVEKAPPRKAKLTQAELDALNSEALKKLQGHWIFEKSERNGYNHSTLSEESIYIEKKGIQPAKKNGDLMRGDNFMIDKLDAGSPWMEIDLVVRREKFLGICKLEGDRLVIALGMSEDLRGRRPAQFTTRLTAGIERASIVQTYRRAKRE